MRVARIDVRRPARAGARRDGAARDLRAALPADAEIRSFLGDSDAPRSVGDARVEVAAAIEPPLYLSP